MRLGESGASADKQELRPPTSPTTLAADLTKKAMPSYKRFDYDDDKVPDKVIVR